MMTSDIRNYFGGARAKGNSDRSGGLPAAAAATAATAAAARVKDASVTAGRDPHHHPHPDKKASAAKNRPKPLIVSSSSRASSEEEEDDFDDFGVKNKKKKLTRIDESSSKNKIAQTTRPFSTRGNRKRKPWSNDGEHHDDPDFVSLLVSMEAQTSDVNKAAKRSCAVDRCRREGPPSHLGKSAKSEADDDDGAASSVGANDCGGGGAETKALPLRKAPLMSGPEDLGQETELWVDKYKPLSVKAIIGQQGDKSNVKKLTNWFKNWDSHHRRGGKAAKAPSRPPPWQAANDDGAWAKAALLSGPPGVGKTTTAHLVAKELGYDVVELNASDTRSKKQLEAQLGDSLNAKAVADTSLKRVLLMDEVDGMAGNEDRGGVAELISLFKRSKIPVVCMCNDRNHPKIRNLANHCFDLRFQRPRVDQIKAAMMSVCFKEKIKVTPDALTQLITACNHDVRQVLHHLSLMKADVINPSMVSQGSAAPKVPKIPEMANKTSIKLGPWDVCRKVFSASEHKTMTLMDKSDLFFHDYSLSPLFVQENYLSAVPAAAKGKAQTMLLVSKAADSFCFGDMVDKIIRSDNCWNLLPVQAIFASVIPGEFMEGHLEGQIQFPTWLGKNSKQNKLNRILQELQVHTRMRAGLSKTALNQDLLQFLKDAIVGPLIRKGSEGIGESVEVMREYSLLREDLEGLLELGQWTSGDAMKAVDSKVKAAFTRTYNKEVVLPYASNTALKKNSKKATDLYEGLDNDDEAEDDVSEGDQEDGDDAIEADSMIKAKKPRFRGTVGKDVVAAGASKAAKASTNGKLKAKKALS